MVAEQSRMVRNRRRQSASGIPTLAMVDAFVGGVAVLLIMVILSSQTEPKLGETPRADIVLRCVGDRVIFPEMLPAWVGARLPSEVGFEVAAALLASAAPVDGLSRRVRIEVIPSEVFCAMSLEQAVQAENDITDGVKGRVTSDSASRAFLVTGIEVVEQTRGEIEGY